MEPAWALLCGTCVGTYIPVLRYYDPHDLLTSQWETLVALFTYDELTNEEQYDDKRGAGLDPMHLLNLHRSRTMGARIYLCMSGTRSNPNVAFDHCKCELRTLSRGLWSPEAQTLETVFASTNNIVRRSPSWPYLG